MNYREANTAQFNQALVKKLKKESRVASKGKSAEQGANAMVVMKRRYTEDMALAKELGLTIQEITS
tara:strand:+ start:4322 stop:4519 length:198 start_codon:yes stop_codon:yes gene_type:complete